MTGKMLFRIIAAFLLFLPFESRAEIFRYKDDGGVNHFVDDLSLVPEKYRNQLGDSKPLPELNISRTAPSVESRANIFQEIERPKEKKQRKKVEIFMTSWCHHCRNLAASLDAKKISYEKYDIEKDMKAKRQYDEAGLRGVPVTRVGSRFISGNNPDAIMKILYEE